MSPTPRALVGAVAAAALVGVLPALPAHAATSEVQIVAINDFHGYLQDPGSRVPTAAHVAGAVKAFEAQNENTVLVGAGDLIGASPFVSSSQRDAPTLDALNVMGLDVSAVGNHEFDRGYADLAGRVARRADFPYIGANVQGESPELAPSHVEVLPNGTRVGFVGVVTQETGTLVAPQGIAGITFTDPVAAANAEAARLADSTDVLVLLAHEGPSTGATTPEACATIAGRDDAFGRILRGASPAFDAVFGGHTHLVVDCDVAVPGTDRTRPVLEGGQYGANVMRLRLTVDDTTGAVTAVARGTGDANRVVRVTPAAFPADPIVKAIVENAAAEAAEIGRERIGSITADIRRARTASGAEDRGAESALGNLIADVQLDATRDPARGGSQIALMNPGGLRADFLVAPTGDEPSGVVTYEEAATVQPFANTLFTQTLTGAQLRQVLEEQFQPAGSSRPYLQLGLSKGLTFTADATRPAGSRVTSVRFNGVEVSPTATFRVTTNSFLAGGGDNFRTLAQGTERRDTGLTDLDVLVAYFRANSPVAPPAVDRAVVTGGVTPTPTATSTPTVSATATATASATATPTPTATPHGDSYCVFNAPYRLEDADIQAGQTARLVVPSVAASGTVLVYAYTRPSTEYRLVRTAVSQGGDVTFTLRPPGNTRLYVVRSDCGPRSQLSTVLTVRSRISLGATRFPVLGAGRPAAGYAFSGRVFPARPGQLVSLYRRAGDREVLTSQARVAADGTWTVDRRFLGTGRFDFVARTTNSLENAAGASNVRPTLIF